MKSVTAEFAALYPTYTTFQVQAGGLSKDGAVLFDNTLNLIGYSSNEMGLWSVVNQGGAHTIRKFPLYPGSTAQVRDVVAFIQKNNTQTVQVSDTAIGLNLNVGDYKYILYFQPPTSIPLAAGQGLQAHADVFSTLQRMYRLL
jgi:hypothetical protein